MTRSKLDASRRQVLAWTGAGAISGLMLPGSAFGQSNRKVTIIASSAAELLGWAPSYLAEAMGYYKEEGLEIERIPSNSGAASISALVAGAGDLLLSSFGGFLSAVGRGVQLKTLMAQSNYNALYFLLSKDYAARHGITADMPFEQREAAARKFKGIRIGISSPGSSLDFSARLILKRAGLSPETDAQLIPLGASPNLISAMGAGNIDAFPASPPSPEIAMTQLGAVVLFSVGKGEFPAYSSFGGEAILVRTADVERNPDVFAKVVRADVRALRLINDNRQAAGETLFKARYAKTLAPDLWKIVWANNNSAFKTPYVTKNDLVGWVTNGMVPGVTDPNAMNLDSLIDMKFVDQAVQQIGWKVPT